MECLNISIVEGRLVRVPTLKTLPNGTSFCKLDIAVNEFSKHNGDTKQNTTFLTATIWGKFAAICAKYLEKGQNVRIKGKLRQSNWQGNDGKKHSKLEITAVNVDFLDKAKNSTNKNVNQPQTETVPF